MKTRILLITALVSLLTPCLIMAFTESMTLLQRATSVVLPAGLLLWWFGLSRHIGRSVLLMVWLMILGAFQLVLLDLYGRGPIAVDMWLNLLTTNPGEAGELLGRMAPAIIGVCVLYGVPLVMAIIGTSRHWRLTERLTARLRRNGIVATVTGAGMLGLCLVSGHGGSDPSRYIFPLSSVANACLAAERTALSPDTEAELTAAEHYTFDARLSPAYAADSVNRRIVVLVIGETARAESWGLLGYGRNTTPRLDRIARGAARGKLYAFGDAWSQSNTTHKSVPLMLSPLTPEAFGDSISRVKSVISAFSEAGYRTAFFSNQDRNHADIDRFGLEADTTVFMHDRLRHGEPHTCDLELAQMLNDELARTDDSELIVLHTYGSHFAYDERYDKTFRQFTPDAPCRTGRHNRPVLVNAYDNTVLQTDSLLAAVIGVLDNHTEPGTVTSMVYAADHGEDIYDDSRGLFLHASPYPSAHQLHVPMLVYAGPGLQRLRPGLTATLTAATHKPVYTSTSVFHTLLDLGGITCPTYNATHSVAAPDYTPGRYTYLSDRNSALSIDQCGLTDTDLALMHPRRLTASN